MQERYSNNCKIVTDKQRQRLSQNEGISGLAVCAETLIAHSSANKRKFEFNVLSL